MAVLSERERLARELHDSLGGILGYVTAQTLAARDLLSRGDMPATDSHLKRLAEVSRDAQADVREHIHSLQASNVSDQGLLSALEQYMAAFSRHNDIQTDLIIPDRLADLAFEPSVETQLMRIIQEALTNVRKHADAGHASVTFTGDHDVIQVTIKDDGCGFDAARMAADGGSHFGLGIMHERAEEIGAGIQVESIPDQGTTVTVIIPLGSDQLEANSP